MKTKISIGSITSFLVLCLTTYSCTTTKQATGFNNGNDAPVISLPDSSGKDISIADDMGKFVLLEFWSSTNKPAREDHVRLEKLYEENKDKHFKYGNGFTICSISFDQNMAAWKKALVQDNTTWPQQMIDLKGFSSDLSIKYNISTLPRYILLDKDGVVVNQNLLVADLNDILKKAL